MGVIVVNRKKIAYVQKTGISIHEMYSLLHIPHSTVYYILTKLMRFGLKATPRKITMGSVDSEARGVQSSQLSAESNDS